MEEWFKREKSPTCFPLPPLHTYTCVRVACALKQGLIVVHGLPGRPLSVPLPPKKNNCSLQPPFVSECPHAPPTCVRVASAFEQRVIAGDGPLVPVNLAPLVVNVVTKAVPSTVGALRKVWGLRELG